MRRRAKPRSIPPGPRPVGSALHGLRLTAEIYEAVRATSRAMEATVSTVLKRHHRLDGETKRIAVETAYDMLRHARFVEAGRRHIPFETNRDAVVALYLIWRGDGEALPISAGERAGIAQALAAVTHRLQNLSEAAVLAHHTPMPEWAIERMHASLGIAPTRAICEGLAGKPPITLRANTLRTTREALLEALAQDGIAARACRFSPVGVEVEHRFPVHLHPLFRAGHFERQDEGSQLLGLLCDIQPGMRVIDACAGAGGKTLHLAASLENRGVIEATDVHTGRLDELKRRARRAGAHNIRVRVTPRGGDFAPERGARSADVVLVDAPCTGTGTLRRAPDIGFRLAPASLERLVAEQQHILQQAARWVRPGGRLVYATCSVLPEEGAEQVARFLTENPTFALRSAGELLRRQDIPGFDDALLVLRPDLHGTDGFFGAVCEQTGA